MNNLLRKEYHFGISALLRAELQLAGGLKLLLTVLGPGIVIPFLPPVFCKVYRLMLLLYLLLLPQIASIRSVKSGWNRYLRTLPHPESRIVNARHLFYVLLLACCIIWIFLLHIITNQLHGSLITPELDRLFLLYECTCTCLAAAVMLPFTTAAERFDKGWLSMLAWIPVFLISMSSCSISIVLLISDSELVFTPERFRNGLLVIVLSHLLSWILSRFICIRRLHRKPPQLRTEREHPRKQTA